MSNAATLPQPAQDALEKFPVAFHGDEIYDGEIGAAWAPGRVNLIGEHTDYNDGYVLPIAIDRVTAFAGRRRDDDIVRVWSRQFEEYVQFALDGLPGTFEQVHAGMPSWARYVLGVATELAKVGMPLSGFDAVVDGNVPLGGGMSSSAALEVATAQACAHFSDGRFTIGAEHATLRPLEVAALCQNAEHRASGVQSGILDQAASCLGRPEYAVFLDCRSLDYRYLPFQAPDLSLVVIGTGVSRELSSSAYNERREQCEEAMRLLRDMILQVEPEHNAVQHITALRDITPEQFVHYGPELPELLR
ncbi:MAG: galactokinase family protein, partial [Ktedonobacteraceae bacterium]